MKNIIWIFLLIFASTIGAQTPFIELKPQNYLLTADENVVKNRILSPDMAESTWLVKVNPLEQSVNGKTLTVQMPDWSSSVTFTATGVYSMTPNEYYWSGMHPSGHLIQITKIPTGTIGTVASQGRYYGIEVLSPETSIIIKYSSTFLPTNDVCGVVEESGGGASPETPVGCTPTDNEIRVLFLFSPAAAAKQGTFGAAALASQVIGELNAACTASGLTPVQASFTLAGISSLAGFVEDPCSYKTKKALLNNVEAKATRSIFLADIVCLIIDDVHLQNPPCDASGSAVDNAGAADAYCFAEISTALNQFKATHGIGHVLGLGHQRCSNCWNLRCISNPGEGYARGLRINATTRTIMADCDGTLRTAAWSANGVTLGGFSLGDPANDNARKLRERANAVACFQPPPPKPPATITIDGSLTICGGATRTYTVSSSGGNVSLANWSMKTDVTLWEPAGTGESVTITAPTDGVKTITLRVNVPGNGGGSATITIRVAACRSNPDAMDRSNEQTSETKITIFPNPSRHQFFVEGTLTTDDIILQDIQGKIIHQQKGGDNISVETQRFPYGMYFLTVAGLQGTQRFKIIKQ